MELLIEHWGQPGGSSIRTEHRLEESSGGKPGLYIEGIFMQADVVNRNRRLYPKPILEKAVSKYLTEQVRTNQALGELNHPPRANVDPNLAAIIIEDLWWEGSNVMGRARVIEGDNGPGDKLAANIKAGWIPGVSSRGLGTVTKARAGGHNIVNEGFQITVGVDVVWGPSAPDAWVKPRVVEATDTAIKEAQIEVNPNDVAFRQLAENLLHK